MGLTESWRAHRAGEETAGGCPRDRRSASAPRVKVVRSTQPVRSSNALRPAKDRRPRGIRGAREGRLPEILTPQLATLVDRVPEGEDWIHETKFDGYRILARIDHGQVRLITRRANDWTDRFAAIARDCSRLGVESALIDGEVVALDRRGMPSFESLQQSFGQPGRTSLLFYAFDLVHLDGMELSGAGLEDRKGALERVLAAGSRGSSVRYSTHVVGHGSTVFREACARGLEGIISKRKAAPYRPGRSRDWLKVKCVLRQEFVIGGYVPGQRSRERFGALLIGVYDAGGDLRFAGKVGAGFDEATIDELLRRFGPLARPRAPFIDPPKETSYRNARWLGPELVAEIRFTEWTRDGKLRHPAFVGLREDKSAQEVRREEPDHAKQD